MNDEQVAKEWLFDWEYNSDNFKKYINLDVNLERHFKKKKKRYIVYRALKWNDDDIKKHLLRFHDNLNFEKYELNSSVDLNLKELTSWTSNINITKQFLYNNNNYDYGILIKTNVNYNEILVDIDLTLNDNRLQEIILRPGLYKCEIKEIKNNKSDYNKDLSFGLYKYNDI